MSGLRALIAQLRADTLRCSPDALVKAQKRRAALRDHPTMGSVLAALGEDSEDGYPAREALTRALLEEHRMSGGALWSSALLVAYYPMLSRLRHRLVSPWLPREELDQVVVTAFLAAVNEVPLELDRMPMRLRQRTERQVFAVLRKEREHHYPTAELDELAVLGTDSIQQRRLPEPDEDMFELSLLLDRAAARGVAPSGLGVVEATVLGRELLRSYVERTGPDDEIERERTYQRLKRQRSRALRRLRGMIQMSPIAVVAAL